MTKIDVLIVGAGPTGLMMASELLRYGLTCRIIDKENAPTTKSKAIAIQARTLEVLQHANLIEPFLREGLKLHAGAIFCKKRCVAKIHLDKIRSPFPFVLSLEQSHTEAIFTQHLKKQGLRIERQVELTDFKDRDNFIEATLKHHGSGAEEKIIVDWLIGCDGAHSIVRKRIGATFKGKLFKDIFSLADVEIDWDLPHDQVTAFIEPEGVMAALPLPGERRYRLIFQLKRCRDLLKIEHRDGIIEPSIAPIPTLEETRDLLCTYLGREVPVTNPLWLANFHINSRLASIYQKGRVFLAGDAAHIHSPVGGQGMNTGIQDAFNLAWKLAWVQQKKGNKKLLQSYEIERHSVGEDLLRLTETASTMVTLHNRILVAVRNFFLSQVTQFNYIQQKLTDALSENGIHYPHSPLNRQHGHFLGTLQLGDRAPDGTVLVQDKMTSLFVLWKGLTKGIILLFAGDALDAIQQLETLADRLEKRYPVQAFIITADPYTSPSHRVAIDPDLKVHEIYGVDEPSVYFIRPDLYVGYRQTGLDPSKVEDYLSQYLER